MFAAGYMGQKEGVKVGHKGEQNSPKRVPPDVDIFGRKPRHSWNALNLKKQAGLSLLLQVAGRPLNIAGRLGQRKKRPAGQKKWPVTP